MKIADEISKKVLHLYSLLPQNGKPDSTQFTVLSSIVAHIDGEGEFVICICTGTKCLSNQAEICEHGSTLSDSHAEVLARRSLILFLMQSALEIMKINSYQENNFCPFQYNQNEMKFSLKKTWSFWLYVSDSPCGCASIYDRSVTGRPFTGKKSRLISPSTSSDSKSEIQHKNIKQG
jgi:tRNA-specific adenosine deaminase 1